jgi:DNA-binding NarL/FixJ family response regulator
MTERADQLQVLIVEDEPFTRTMLQQLIASHLRATVMATHSASEGIQFAQSQFPQLAIIDFDLGDGPNGLDLALALRRNDDSISLVFLSTYASPRLLSSYEQMIPDRSAFISKQLVSSTEILLSAVDSALNRQHLPRAISSDFIEGNPIVDKLSDQNIKILRYISDGLSNKEIADRLFVNERAVEKSIARMIKSLDIHADVGKNQRVTLVRLFLRLTGKNA